MRMNKEAAGLDGAQWPGRVAGGLACMEGWMVLHLGPIREHVGSVLEFPCWKFTDFPAVGPGVRNLKKNKKTGGVAHPLQHVRS